MLVFLITGQIIWAMKMPFKKSDLIKINNHKYIIYAVGYKFTTLLPINILLSSSESIELVPRIEVLTNQLTEDMLIVDKSELLYLANQNNQYIKEMLEVYLNEK